MSEKQSSLVQQGILLVLATLILAEVYALFAAAARIPGVYQWLPSTDFFHVALVTHVNLAIVIWFLAFIGVLCLASLLLQNEDNRYVFRVAKIGLMSLAVGMFLVASGPFIGADFPIMSNYIPVLDHPIFFTALMMVLIGVILMLSLPFLSKEISSLQNLLPIFSFGMKTTAVTFFIALICLVLAYTKLPLTHDLFYFEKLFWGPGHILQFVNTLALLSCWILLFHNIFGKTPLQSISLKILLSLIVGFALPGPFFFFLFDIQSPEFTQSFTFLMRWGLGTSTLIIGGTIVVKTFLYQSFVSWKDPRVTTLLFSIIVFALGGTIGSLIDYSDVKIPAHYHGSIGAVTIAFMGSLYVILPLIGKEVVRSKWNRWQPILCGTGGILFVSGLFWAGSHGVARKVSGAGQGLDNLGKIMGMSLMGIGGLITSIGVVIFIFVVVRSLYPKQTVSVISRKPAVSSIYDY